MTTVLSFAKVHPGLYPDTGVNKPDQGGRDSDVRRASAINAGSEAHNVEQHASSDGDDGLAAAVDASLDHRARH